jgi:nucleoside-diphosphate-sugar epimerase
MKVLIIGGTGFIGSHVSNRLISEGHNISVFHRGLTGNDMTRGVEHVCGDRKEILSFADEFKKLAPEVVLDLIAYVEQEAIELMETFRHLARRVVIASSMDVYQSYGRFLRIESGPPGNSLLDEDSPLRSQLYPYRKMAQSSEDMAYNYDKILVERAVMSDRTLAGTVLRLPKVYGPGDNQHHLFEHLKRIDDHRPAIILEEGRAAWRWTRGHVEDVGEAISLAVTHDAAANRIYNIGERSALTEAEWVKRIGEASGWRGKVVSIGKDQLPIHLAAPYDWEHHLAFDTSRVRRELGFKDSITREESLRRTIAWERANPPKDVSPDQFDYAAEDIVLKTI